MEVTRIFDLLPHYKEKFTPKDDTLAGKEDGKWMKYTIGDYIDFADSLSYAFLSLDVEKGDRIATISNNRPEWNFLDMGILQMGAIHVPIYPTISEADYKYILNHAEVKYVFISGKEILRKIEHILPDIPSLKGVYAFRKTTDLKHWSELVELGRQNQQPGKLEEIKKSITPDDVATLIYTSGTTGQPKGVLLSHNNLISNFKAVYHIFPVDEFCKALSYLPLCHVYERLVNYTCHYKGTSIYYAENFGTIVDNIKDIRPHIVTTVPRLLEKIYDTIIARGLKLKGLKRMIFFWAVHLGLQFEPDSANGWYYEMRLKLANKLVFSKWREALGGRFRVIVSGGAALQPRLARIYTAAGIPVLEGYGLTETSPAITVNDLVKGGRKFGTVGPVIKDVQVRIADDGEILCKGPNVMIGYYKEPGMTREAVDQEGWFHTGDLGVIEDGKFLKITGRKKEIFKTSFGKYISPQPIENKFKESPFIDSLVVIGENQKFAAALIVPDFEHLKSWCRIKGIDYTTNEDIIKLPVIKKRYQVEVEKFNSFFGATEHIKKFELLDHEWSVESGDLTANLKLKRELICEKYKDIIARIFNISDDL